MVTVVFAGDAVNEFAGLELEMVVAVVAALVAVVVKIRFSGGGAAGADVDGKAGNGR